MQMRDQRDRSKEKIERLKGERNYYLDKSASLLNKVLELEDELALARDDARLLANAVRLHSQGDPELIPWKLVTPAYQRHIPEEFKGEY